MQEAEEEIYPPLTCVALPQEKMSENGSKIQLKYTNSLYLWYLPILPNPDKGYDCCESPTVFQPEFHNFLPRMR